MNSRKFMNGNTTWLHQVLNGGCGRNTENPHDGTITNFFKEKVARTRKVVGQSKAVSQAARRGVQRAVGQAHKGRRGGARR